MPLRQVKFVNGHFYHIFNKTIDSRKVFANDKYNNHFVKLLKYYRSNKAMISYSRFKILSENRRKEILKELTYRKYFRVQILSFSLMPTHFHLLLNQVLKGGIKKYLSDTTNSLTKYFNITNKRTGPIFMPRFKAERIKSEAQLLHVARYIDINAFSGDVVRSLKELEKYPWSSYREHIAVVKDGLCDSDEIIRLFDDKRENYKDFVDQHADYQKGLEAIKHLEKW